MFFLTSLAVICPYGMDKFALTDFSFASKADKGAPRDASFLIIRAPITEFVQ